ncbi:unnamed protein product [Musa acuminata subsp. malaccensis]|uniref:(wild Malaysian banana) hypothetical protein n=1 Tax=Musa acuminata subsp. malaccensis TaxID=214687 RepID=A0A8D7ABD9_MUSAM|nr:unnamed protein product [Musa acuminata subsp. malaccensis]
MEVKKSVSCSLLLMIMLLLASVNMVMNLFLGVDCLISIRVWIWMVNYLCCII